MATVYLSPSGSDAYTYAQAQNPATPWLTFGKLQTSALTGDTVSVAAGTYTFAAVSFTKAFTIIGASANGTSTSIVDGTTSGDVQWAFANAGNTFSVSNIIFQNITHGVSGFRGFLENSGGNVVVTNCLFKSITLRSTAGLCGLFSITSATAGSTYTIINCMILNPITTGSSVGSLLSTWNTANAVWTITNCTAYFTTAGVTAITHIQSDSSGATGISIVAKNNIIYNGTGGTITWSTNAPTNTGSNNCFYLLTNAPALTGNITSNPLFVDAANSNFNLRPASPCIDTGVVI